MTRVSLACVRPPQGGPIRCSPPHAPLEGSFHVWPWGSLDTPPRGLSHATPLGGSCVTVHDPSPAHAGGSCHPCQGVSPTDACRRGGEGGRGGDEGGYAGQGASTTTADAPAGGEGPESEEGSPDPSSGDRNGGPLYDAEHSNSERSVAGYLQHQNHISYFLCKARAPRVNVGANVH